MEKDHKLIPVDVVKLLPVLDSKLITLLKSLTTEDWYKPTVAKQWVVKDVVAHLLDGNIRILSMLRDGYYNKQPGIRSHQDLLDYLNGLNADWVKAMKRVSPDMLILLHEATGKLYCDYYASLDPFGISPFAVDWAGEKESFNRMQIAREYTEKWLHQQQVRYALNDTGLMTKEFFYPFIEIFMLALPYTYRDADAPEGSNVRITVPGEIGGNWVLKRTDGKWVFDINGSYNVTSELIIDADISWQLFSKSTRPDQIRDMVRIEGDLHLGEIALSMVSVMA